MRYALYFAATAVALVIAFAVASFLAAGFQWLDGCPPGSRLADCDPISRLFARVGFLGLSVALWASFVNQIDERLAEQK